MTLQDFTKLLRTRWMSILVAILVGLAGAATVTLLTTPLYQASTRLFVATTAGSTLTETYQGNRSSQERVVSYVELLMGETLAQRTIDKLGLDMSATTLQEHVTASAKLDTVLIDVVVLDESAVRARDIANVLSDEFVVMVRDLETPEDGAAPDTRVVVEQRASVADHPVVPKTARNMSIGLALGVIIGIGLALLRDLLDNTVKQGQTLEHVTGVGLVGNIPLDKGRRNEPAITFDGDNSTIAESFRKLRTNLQFLRVDSPPRLIIVTSSMPGEGKSTTAINIALVLAEAGNEVALIDGDMRRPALDKYLNVVGSVGLSTVLIGQASLDEALQKTSFARVTVLTSGASPPNPSELLGTDAAKKVLNEMRDRFDYVIVDSSPLLAVTDAALLASHSDGALMMARYGHTKREHVEHAVSSLEDVGAQLLGAVLTMTPPRGDSSYGYGYYTSYTSDRQPSSRARTTTDAPRRPNVAAAQDQLSPGSSAAQPDSRRTAPQ